MHIKSKRCKACQARHNAVNNAAHRQRKRDGISRIIGEYYPCEHCGQLYELASGGQRWCKLCADRMHKVVDRELSRTWYRKAYADPEKREEKNARRRSTNVIHHICPICGKAFDSVDPHDVYCSRACYNTASAGKNASYEAARRTERNEYHRKKHQEKLDAMTTEQQAAYRQEVNRRARENYAKRKALKTKEDANHD